MNFGVRAWLCGLASGVLLTALIAAVPTALDWVQNPGGIFHSEGLTQWTFVRETFFSWFWPVLLLTAPFTVLVFAWLAGRRGGGPCCRGCR